MHITKSKPTLSPSPSPPPSSSLPPFIILVLAIILICVNNVDGVLTNVAGRYGHTATLIDNKLYFIGGRGEKDAFVSSLIVVDMSQPFNLLDVSTWPAQEITDNDLKLNDDGSGNNLLALPKINGHSASSGIGDKLNDIIIIGGSVQDPIATQNQNVLIFDTITKRFVNPAIIQQKSTNAVVNNSPTRRYEHSCVIDQYGEIWIYGGKSDDSTGSQKSYVNADMWGLNSPLLPEAIQWQNYGSLESSPGSLQQHTVSLISGNRMVVLGGMNDLFLLDDFKNIHVYDLNANNWSTYAATGNIPASRRDHSAVVLNNTKIIIYGGADERNSVIYADVAVLDTDTWIWSTPTTTGTPIQRFRHTATLIGINMVVAFGNVGLKADSSMYVLNTANWSWSYDYQYITQPSDGSSEVSNITNPNPYNGGLKGITINLPLIIGLSVGGVVLLILGFSILIYIIVRKHRREAESGLILVSNRYTRPPSPANDNGNHANMNENPSPSLTVSTISKFHTPSNSESGLLFNNSARTSRSSILIHQSRLSQQRQSGRTVSFSGTDTFITFTPPSTESSSLSNYLDDDEKHQHHLENTYNASLQDLRVVNYSPDESSSDGSIASADSNYASGSEIKDPHTAHIFYANPETGECSWERPKNSNIQQKDPKGEWWELWDEAHQLPYYYHTLTGRTEWIQPEFGTIIPLTKIQFE
nr:7328_t:CDS:2 [Entrophospora candida]